MSIKHFAILLVFIEYFVLSYGSIDYCDPELCGKPWDYGLKHIACNPFSESGASCDSSPKVNEIKSDTRFSIVRMHNKLRHNVASGNLDGYRGQKLPKAIKMAHMIWDDELATLALLSALQCKDAAMFCVNTHNYRASGQMIITYRNSTSKPLQYLQSLKRIGMYGKLMDPAYIRKYPKDSIAKTNGFEHFAIMIIDHNNRIGCASVTTEQESYFVCHYASRNMPNLKIYETGETTASACTKTHQEFYNLCESTTEIDPNVNFKEALKQKDEQIDPNERFKEMKDVLDDEFYEPELLPKIVERITNRRNYCDPKLCESGEKHVACKPTETFSPSCGSYKMITKFEDFYKFQIVSNHNSLRNLTAGGYFEEGYPAQIAKAVRMAYMQWDDELSDLALLDVKECEDHKKSCHNTPSYKASGQNVFRENFEHPLTQDYCIFLALMSWSPDTHTNWHKFVQNFSNDTPTGRELENFALQVIDRNNRVGCAMSLYYGKDNTSQCNVICNYATKLYNSLPVYKTGNVVASECTRTHEEYSNLCAEDEPINPNDLSNIKPLVNKNNTLNEHFADIVKPKNSTEISDILTPIVNRTQYCDPKMCRKGTHIGCNNTATAGDTCGKVIKLITMTPERIDIILKTHNELRNLTAGGDAPGSQNQKLPKAVRMGRVQWDQELADLALLNAKTCIFAHDPCHNTEKYKMAGQNIAQFMASRALEPNTYLKKSVIDWFSESIDTTADHITSYSRSTQPNKPIGHFTQVVNDKSTRVGCAAIIFNVKRDGRILEALLHVCNYARTNILNKPIYKAGTESASECKAKDNVYINLCHESEDIDPNEVFAAPPTDTFPSRGDLDDFDKSYDNDFGMTAPPGFLFVPIAPKPNDTSDTTPSTPKSDDYLRLFERDWNEPSPGEEITMPPLSMPTLPTYTTQNIHDLLPHSVTEESVTTESFTTQPNVTTEAVKTIPHSITEEPITTVAIPTEADIQTTPYAVTEKSTDVPETTTTTERVIQVPRIGATEVEEETTPIIPSSSTTPKTPKHVDDKSGEHTRPRPSKPRRPLPNEDDYFIIRSRNPVYDDDDDDGILIMS